MSEVRVRRTGPREYAVEVDESPGGRPTTHRVRVDDAVLADLALPDPDPETEDALVRESFAFLLQREPATSILGSFALSQITQYFPSYPTEIRSRLR